MYKRQPLGIVRGARHDNYTASLSEGATLVVITDGLPEMMDAAGEFYSMERVAADIASVSGGIPEEIVTELANRVLRFAAGALQADDVTVLAVRIGVRVG